MLVKRCKKCGQRILFAEPGEDVCMACKLLAPKTRKKKKFMGK